MSNNGKNNEMKSDKKLDQLYIDSKKLLDHDSIFVEEFGSEYQLKTWKKGKEIILSGCCNWNELMKCRNMMGQIRETIHQQNVSSDKYRLLFIQHNPEIFPYEKIVQDVGKDFADHVQQLRNKN